MPKCKRKYTSPESFLAQPRIVAIMRLLRRKRGATGREIARALDWNEASVRAVISRLRQVDVAIEGKWQAGRGFVLRVAK